MLLAEQYTSYITSVTAAMNTPGIHYSNRNTTTPLTTSPLHGVGRAGVAWTLVANAGRV